jgi:hypothetical protein
MCPEELFEKRSVPTPQVKTAVPYGFQKSLECELLLCCRWHGQVSHVHGYLIIG